MSGASLKLTLKIRRHDQWPLFANFLLDSLSEDLLLQSVSLKANSVGILFPFLTFQYCGFIFCSMMSQLPTSLWPSKPAVRLQPRSRSPSAESALCLAPRTVALPVRIYHFSSLSWDCSEGMLFHGWQYAGRAQDTWQAFLSHDWKSTSSYSCSGEEARV